MTDTVRGKAVPPDVTRARARPRGCARFDEDDARRRARSTPLGSPRWAQVDVVSHGTGFELVVGDAGKKLILRDAQHEYIFDASP
jgi:hypothetical protein